MFYSSVVINSALPKELKPEVHINYTLMGMLIRSQMAGSLETMAFISFLHMPKPLWPSGTHLEPAHRRFPLLLVRAQLKPSKTEEKKPVEFNSNSNRINKRGA